MHSDKRTRQLKLRELSKLARFQVGQVEDAMARVHHELGQLRQIVEGLERISGTTAHGNGRPKVECA